MSKEPTSATRSGYPWWPTIIGVVIIMIFPWIMSAIASDNDSLVTLGFLQLLVINSAVFVIGTVWTWIRFKERTVIVPLAYSLAFIVSTLMWFNTSALIYLLGYLLLTAAALGVDYLFARLTRKFPRRR